MDRFFEGTSEILQNLLLSKDVFASIPESYFKYLQFIPIFVIAFIATLLLTPIIGQTAKKLKIIDIPGRLRATKLNKYDNPDRHTHKKPTPNLGGLAVIVPFIISLIVFLQLDPTIIALLISVLLLTIVGVMDDAYNMPATVQFLAQSTAALIIAFVAVDLTYVNNPFGGIININWTDITLYVSNTKLSLILPGDLLIIPWIIFCTNALKWVSGSDGLLEGNMIIAFLLIAVLGVRNQTATIVIMSIFLAGGLSGFLVYNFPPAKIFSASVGKTLYGFLVAVLAIMNGSKVATTILIIALPLVDSLFVMVRRYIIYRPKNLIDLMRINGKDHLHHQLIKMNLSAKQILLIEVSVTLFFGSIAILTTGATKFFALIFTLFLLAVLILYINNKAQQKVVEKGETEAEDSPESKYRY